MCNHELKKISDPQVVGLKSIFSQTVYRIYPIFQCVKCFKVFTFGKGESCLVEIPLFEISKEGKDQFSKMYKEFYEELK